MIKERLVRLLPEELVWWLCKLMYKVGISKPLLSDIVNTGRIVEYPWVWSNIHIKEGKVLDVGYCGSYFILTLASIGFKVVGVDINEDKYVTYTHHWNFLPLIGDVFDTPLPSNHFDLVTLVSTIEHIGLKDDGDFKCMDRLYELLKDDGHILVTAPFGKAATFKGYRVYDMERVQKMWKGRIEKIEFFKLDGKEWYRRNLEGVEGVEMTSKGRTQALFCAVLSK